MNTRPATGVYDPDDPLFKSLRHRYYRLGADRRKILGVLLAIPTGVQLGKDAEKEFLFEIARDGRIAELLKLVEEMEAEKQSASEMPERAPF